jgi:hypothetical protein
VNRGALLSLGVRLGAALLLSACSGAATPGPLIGGVRTPTLVPAATLGSAGAGPSFATVPIDSSLLRFLPSSVGGLPVNYSAEATQEVVTDQTLVVTAARVAYGMAVDPATGDLVVAAVVELRDGVYGDAFYRDWRTTYDGAACAPAGGAVGHAEATLGGRTVYIGTCTGGAHTYHTYLDRAGVLVSATSVGAKRFGELLVANLRP